MTAVGTALIALGASLTLVAAVGVVRLPDVYSRLHAATKATSLGIAFLLVGVAVRMPEIDVAIKAVVAILLQFATAPVAGHVLARRAHQSGLEFHIEVDELRDDTG